MDSLIKSNISITASFKSPFKEIKSNWQINLIMGFMLIAGGHFVEHFIQIFQYLVLNWSARESGGVLGLWFPGLAASEYLHSGWNTLQLTGLILLWLLFRQRGNAALFWKLAIFAQIWHWFEHVLLQIQYLTGYYLFMPLSSRACSSFSSRVLSCTLCITFCPLRLRSLLFLSI